MKNNPFILIGAVIVVIVVASTFLFRGGVAPATSTAITSAPALATTLAPDMTLIIASSTKSLLIASTTEANVGDTLVTSHNGRGLLQMANGTETLLDYDTKFTLAESDGLGTHVSGFLGTGAMWARVEKVFGKGEYYKIKTQNAVAVVRGTSFGLSYKRGVSTLQVATGTVGLMPVDLSTGAPLENKEVFVSGGHGATIDDSGTVSVSSLTTTDKHIPWYLYNNTDEPKAQESAPTTQSSPKTSPQTVPKTTTAPSRKATPTSVANTSSASAENACSSFSDQGYAGSQARSSLKLISVSPLSVSQSDQSVVTLTGKGFVCATTIAVGEKILSGESDFIIVDNSTITFSSSLLPVGTFDIVINDSLENTATLPQAITITQ